ncbi:MAG: hypothetical protein CENE_00244 [Candidatus Celerinatantimonas neptuna]|nr:MAG: hypothetical protein CENE_00244 [Candidatus Celerinatantimonas neptuna]
MLLEQLNYWIDKTIERHVALSQSCDCFKSEFLGYFNADFLRKCCFVVTDTLPFPRLERLYPSEGYSFISNKRFPAVAYKDMYFIHSEYQHDLSVHLHELIHICQWQLMGIWFLQQCLDEWQDDNGLAPSLEQQAIDISRRYVKGKRPVDVKSLIYSYI